MASKRKSGVAAVVSLGAVGLTGAGAGSAAAQDSTASDVTLDTITVAGSAGAANSNNETVSTAGRSLATSVRDMPQVVNVVSPELIKQKNVTTLEEALKNVPGVTLSSGEGRGGLQGDQFRLRGIQAKGDIYTDGLRDFGTYAHDMFNTDAVTVIKGPTGEAFGVGNLGGVINMQTKKAHLGDQNSASLGWSTGGMLRETVDLNKQISDTSAIRLNLMNQRGSVADRDHVSQNRQGLAVDFGTGIGTDTEWHLSYEYLKGRGKPDQGQPLGLGSDGIYTPLLEFDIPGYSRDTSYVRSTDKDDFETHMLTSSFRHDLDAGVTITNETRIKHYQRDFSVTTPGACAETCLAALEAGSNYALSYGAGGGVTNKQDGWGFENMTAAHFDGDLFGTKNRGLFGLDFSYQKDHRIRGAWTGRNSDQTVLDPAYAVPGASLSYNRSQPADSTALNIGLVAADRLWFDKAWSVQASARADYFDSSFDGYTIGATSSSHTDSDALRVSPAFSLIFEPNAETMGYLSVARSYRPIGTDIASTAQGTSATVANDAYAPERSDSVELGGKMDLFDGALGLSGAIFQIDKKNSFMVDDEGNYTTGFSEDGNAIRIRGVELGASGHISPAWTVTASYAYLDGKVTGGHGVDATTIGNQAPGVARHNLALWTNYQIPQAVVNLPGDLSIGGGVTFASKYYTSAANTARIPETISLDAAIAYETDRYRLALNAYNLTDHDNYAAAFNASRATPSAGRSFAVTLTTKF